VGTRASRRAPLQFVSIVSLALMIAAFAIPAMPVGASVPKAEPAKVVKVGMIVPATSPTAADPDAPPALQAAIAAFNKRGGFGVNHAKLQADVCDSRGDANGEVQCARQLVDDGVVATLNDLTYNNPSGVVNVFESAGIPRIALGPTDISEFQSKVSYPISAGVIAAYLGTAVGFAKDGNKKICLIRTDAPTGATFRGFIAPSFSKIGVDIICDVAVATGATDYSPYIADVQRENPDAVLISHSDAVGTQLIAAMSQLNAKIPLGGSSGTFKLDTLQKYKDITKGTVLSDSFPYPSQNNVKNFPGLRQYFADMKASGKKDLQPNNIKTQAFSSWLAVMAFHNLTKDLDTFTPASVVQTLQTAKDVDMMGLTPPWTPSTPGFSVFKSSSNHYVYISTFDGKNVVTAKTPVDVSQYLT
jgi:ABC-type branched-subunit amino acid transport system substrate-binding protein